jgi:hypothetical protein
MTLGWDAQPELVAVHFMNEFADRYEFHPDVSQSGWPSIVEPTPSVTFDLSSGPSSESMSAPRADETILAMFLTAFATHTRLIAINFNHYGYWFRPYDFAKAERPWPEAWPVHPYPNGDYSIFLTDDMCQGTFGHPWEQTLCVFGQPLIDATSAEPPAWPITRRNT